MSVFKVCASPASKVVFKGIWGFDFRKGLKRIGNVRPKSFDSALVIHPVETDKVASLLLYVSGRKLVCLIKTVLYK